MSSHVVPPASSSSSSSSSSDYIPSVQTLEEIYSAGPAVAKEGKRWDGLTQRFKQIYGGKTPDFVARAPGRVNIIGE